MNTPEQNPAARHFLPEKMPGLQKPPKYMKTNTRLSYKSHRKATESHENQPATPQSHPAEN
jgi:hypothetical protein